MSKTPSQHKPGLYPDNVNKLYFDLLFISEIHMNWVKENSKPAVKHIKDTLLVPWERKIFRSTPGTGSGAPAGRNHFHCWWLWDVRELTLPIPDVAPED